MKISEIAEILNARIHCGEDQLDTEICAACGSDMMSDALAYFKDRGMLLTGLINPQSIRTAEMLDMRCVTFVRGKEPNDAMIQLAKENGIVLLSTRHRMFTACGKLYNAGLRGGSAEDIL